MGELEPEEAASLPEGGDRYRVSPGPAAARFLSGLFSGLPRPGFPASARRLRESCKQLPVLTPASVDSGG